MKRIALLLLLIVLLAFSSDKGSGCLTTLLYLNQEVCEKPISKEVIWFLHGTQTDISPALTLNKATKLTNTIRCADLKKPDTLYSYNQGYLDIFYSDAYADTAYLNLVDTIRKGRKKISNPYLVFCKGGRILCLDKKRSCLRIISINSCAAPSRFKRIITCLKQEKEYSKVFVAYCGGDQYTEF